VNNVLSKCVYTFKCNLYKSIFHTELVLSYISLTYVKWVEEESFSLIPVLSQPIDIGMVLSLFFGFANKVSKFHLHYESIFRTETKYIIKTKAF
jgi:hypothetical protein